MKYYGYMALVMVCLLASVFAVGKEIFTSNFFLVAYVPMAAVLVMGSKYQETFYLDFLLGMLLIFSVGFLSTEVMVKVMTGRVTEMVVFQMAVTVALDYCALGFLRLGRQMRNICRVRKDDRYGLFGQ